MQSYHIITYGCQMNLSDSERVAGYFKQHNFQAKNLVSADLVILNLCSVRQTAINRIWGKLDDVRKRNPKAKIILTGCILTADRKKFAKHADYILEIKDLNNWSKLITHYSLLFTHYNSVKKPNYFSVPPQHTSQHTAYVPIMTGCNNFCSYCVVPYTRGPEVSRPVEEIIKEVNKLVVQGYKHIILLGQNVNSYNSQQTTNNKTIKINFPKLLKLTNKIPGDYWLSFMTSHPKDMSDELIKCFKDCRHLIPYLHLPLQAGSNKVLKAMNRKYTAGQYSRLIRKIRRTISNISISTDIIVGFPGETKKDFQATTGLMKKIKFDMAYLAKYSQRAGTAAAKLKDDVSAEEKTRRFKILNGILKKTALENNKKMIGKEVEVLVERRNEALPRSQPEYFGKTRNFKNVLCHPVPRHGIQKIKIDNFVKVKINKAGAWSLQGKIII